MRGLAVSALATIIGLSILLMTTPEHKMAYAQETFSLDVDGQTYEIPYEITGGTVQDMTLDMTTQTLLVSIDSTDDGTLMIEIPTAALNALDDEFSVFIDGEDGNFVFDELEPTEGSRVLQIEFPRGAEEIEIVGTPMDQDQQPPTETFSLEIEGQTYEIEYEITGGTVESMSADPDTKTLLVTINSTTDGVLSIKLPRTVIDADDDLSVMIDGEADATVDESATAESRVLDIDFSQGSSEIAITGTFLVPEFGIIPAIMLASAVAVVIVASRRYLIFKGLRSI